MSISKVLFFSMVSSFIWASEIECKKRLPNISPARKAETIRTLDNYLFQLEEVIKNKGNRAKIILKEFFNRGGIDTYRYKMGNTPQYLRYHPDKLREDLKEFECEELQLKEKDKEIARVVERLYHSWDSNWWSYIRYSESQLNAKQFSYAIYHASFLATTSMDKGSWLSDAIEGLALGALHSSGVIHEHLRKMPKSQPVFAP